MLFSQQRRRFFHTCRAHAFYAITAVLFFGMLSIPAAGAASAGTGGDSVDPFQVKITEEEAIDKVKELFPLLKDAKMSDASLTTEDLRGGTEISQPVWLIYWTIQIGDRMKGFYSEVHALTGDLLSMEMPKALFSETVSYPPKVNKQQALALARKFVAKAVPSLQSQTLQEARSNYKKPATPLFGPVLYTFSFHASHDGVKVQGQSVQVTISGNGNVTDFRFSNYSVEYPASKPKVTLAEAKNYWKQDLQLQLAYIPTDYQWNRDPNQWSLGYVPIMPLNLLDAQTGQWLDLENKSIDLGNPESFVTLPAVSEPYKAHPVSAEDAIKLIASYADIPEGYWVKSKQLDKGQDGENDTWYLSWGSDNENSLDRNALVDAETGQLLSFYMNQFNPEGAQLDEKTKPTALTKDKAVEIADKWVLSHVPNAASYRRVESGALIVDQETGNVTLSYQMFHHDVMVLTRSVSLTLNSEGRMVGLYASAGMGPTKPIKEKLTSEEAKQKILAATEMQLSYVRSGGHQIEPSGKYVPVTMTLAYIPTDRKYGESFYQMPDAISGKLISPYGTIDDLLASTVAADIQSHWAKTALQAAIDHGVLIPNKDGKVYPNKTVTTGELIRMVSLALNPNYKTYSNHDDDDGKPFADIDVNSPYYPAVSDWIKRGWLAADAKKKLYPQTALTRDQLAVFLTKITGQEKLAARMNKDAIVTRLKDAKSIAHPGAAAVVLKLKLMSAKSGIFRPQGKITVAEAADVLLRLAQIKKWDQPS